MTIKTKYDSHIIVSEKPLDDWIQKRVLEGNFSPTMIFRDAVKELKRQSEEVVSEAYIKRLESNIQSLQHNIQNITEFLTGKDLIEEFYKLEEKNAKPTVGIKVKVEEDSKLK